MNPTRDQKQCFMVKVLILNKYSKAPFGYSLINIRITALCRKKRVFNKIMTIMMMMMVVMMMIVVMSTIRRDFAYMIAVFTFTYNN